MVSPKNRFADSFALCVLRPAMLCSSVNPVHQQAQSRCLSHLFIFFGLMVLLAVGTPELYAQSSTADQPLTAERDNRLNNEEGPDTKVVRTVRLSGNQKLSTRQLKKLLRTRTNREFFGIRRLTPWYYLWRLVGVGEEPSYLNRETVANDMERLQLFYENKGFFDAAIDTSIIEYRKDRVEVSFVITEGERSRVKVIRYDGLPTFSDPNVSARFYRESVFRDREPSDPAVRTADEYYDAQKLRDEQTRIIEFLKNRGYASVVRDSVKARVMKRTIAHQGVSEPEYDVMMVLRPGKIYRFGDLDVTLEAPDEVSRRNRQRGTSASDPSPVQEAQAAPESQEEQTAQPSSSVAFDVVRQDSFWVASRAAPYLSIFRIEKGSSTDVGLLQRQFQFQPGETFNQTAYLESVNRLQTLGILTVNRFGFTADGSVPDYSKDELPVYITMKTDPKHSLQLELFGMQRYGYGSGAGLNYSNINVNGQANQLTLGINASFEFITPETVPSSIQLDGSTIFRNVELSGEYVIPRLIFPFLKTGSGSSRWIEQARTRYSLSYSQSNQLFFDINTDVRFGIRYEIAHSGRRSSLLDVIDMDVIDATLTSEFRQNLIDEFGENSVEFLRIEEDFRPQFSSILRYTYRNQNTDLIKRNYGYTTEFSVAYGGTIPYLVDRLITTPGSLEGNIPSPLGISNNSLSYSQFVKVTFDGRRYFEITPLTVLAYRAFAGVAQPLFQSNFIPLNRRFFAGGSNDIRGWFAFQLGPGSISTEDISVQGGEIKLSAYQEVRQVLFTDLINARWHLAWHVDAGNIWYGPRTTLLDENGQDLLEDGRFKSRNFYKQLAVGSGFGFRADWDFLIFRFDVTYRVHDLQKGWFKNRTPYISFGIGHSF